MEFGEGGGAALTVPCWHSAGRQTSCKLVGRSSGWTGRTRLCPVWHFWCRTCRTGCCRCRLSGHTPSARHPRTRWCDGKLPKRPHRNGWRRPSLSICWWCERRSGTEKVGLIPYCWSHTSAIESATLRNRNPACLKWLLSCADHKLWRYFTYCRHGNVQPHRDLMWYSEVKFLRTTLVSRRKRVIQKYLQTCCWVIK